MDRERPPNPALPAKPLLWVSFLQPLSIRASGDAAEHPGLEGPSNSPRADLGWALLLYRCCETPFFIHSPARNLMNLLCPGAGPWCRLWAVGCGVCVPRGEQGVSDDSVVFLLSSTSLSIIPSWDCPCGSRGRALSKPGMKEGRQKQLMSPGQPSTADDQNH